MPSRLTKIALLCACAVIGSSTVNAKIPTSALTSYNPPIKITTNPVLLPIGGTVSVTGSVFNKTPTGPNPPGLTLRVVAADSQGNWPATGGTTYPKPPNPSPQPIGSQNWAHWSNATFDQVTVPSVPANHTLAMIAHYAQWNAILKRYVEMPGAVNSGAAIFRMRCNKIHICSWVKD